MRLIIFMVGLVIFAGSGMWDRFSISDFVLILVFSVVVFIGMLEVFMSMNVTLI